MWKAKRWVAVLLLCGSAATTVAAEGAQAPGMPGMPGVQFVAQGQLQKTRSEVKRELAAARESGCMDVPDSRYPQPCPLPGEASTRVDAFRMQ